MSGFENDGTVDATGSMAGYTHTTPGATGDMTTLLKSFISQLLR